LAVVLGFTLSKLRVLMVLTVVTGAKRKVGATLVGVEVLPVVGATVAGGVFVFKLLFKVGDVGEAVGVF